jgi:phosphate transport system protein
MRDPMRASFDRQLDSLSGQLIMMAASAASAIRGASVCLFASDLMAAGRVLDAASDLSDSRRSVESHTFELLARRQPVATDLRLAWASIQVCYDLERMGALAAHVAKTMIRRHPAPVVPASLTGTVRSMAELAELMAWKLTRVLEVRHAPLADEIIRADDEMDALKVRLIETVLTDWSYGIATAVDVAQLGRFYERYADHVVNAAHRVAFLITGRSGEPGPSNVGDRRAPGR